MLYVAGFKGQYLVIVGDTDDNTFEDISRMALLELVFVNGVEVKGVTPNSIDVWPGGPPPPDDDSTTPPPSDDSEYWKMLKERTERMRKEKLARFKAGRPYPDEMEEYKWWKVWDNPVKAAGGVVGVVLGR